MHANNLGIFISTSSNNSILHNNFINNTKQAKTEDSTNSWDNGCEGNYWSNYNGTDWDGDGVGETYLPWEEVDSYPLMNPFWTSADVNHDLKVDMRDIGLAARAFGATSGQERWNPHCDIVPDGKIDMRDVGEIAGSFGRSV